MNLFALLSNISLPDILDILLISIIAYQLYIWFWGTKAFKALAGIILLSCVFLLAKSWGLFLTTWVFQILWQVFVILLIILFQKEIRLVLERFNPLKSIGFKQNLAPNDWIPKFVDWALEKAKKKTGSIIIFERYDRIYDLITKGVLIEADPLPEILNSIFNKKSDLHDGAVLITSEKIMKACCYLPLSAREDLPAKYGTRHRAAIGLAEQCDAFVMIISEERGEISFAIGDKIQTIKDKKNLTQILEKAIARSIETDKSVKKQVQSWFTRRYKIKISVTALVCVIWILLAGQQNFEKKIFFPLKFNNLPSGFIVSQPLDQQIAVTFKGLRKDVSLINKENINAVLDLSSTTQKVSSHNITTRNLIMPDNKVNIINIVPSRIKVTIKKDNKKTDIKKK